MVNRHLSDGTVDNIENETYQQEQSEGGETKGNRWLFPFILFILFRIVISGSVECF